MTRLILPIVSSVISIVIVSGVFNWLVERFPDNITPVSFRQVVVLGVVVTVLEVTRTLTRKAKG